MSQHAAAGGHGFGEHAPPTVHVCALSPHEARGSIQHTPFTKLQHLPSTRHGFGEQVGPADQTRFAPVHAISLDTKHTALTMLQQWPSTAGQGFGEQEVPASQPPVPGQLC
jgi:hypothetical protein